MTTLDERPDDHTGETREAIREDRLAGLAGASVLLAGAIHLAVAPSHLLEAPVIGVLFLGLGLAQVATAVAFRTARGLRFLLGVIAVHLAVVSLYVASRTVELPFMPPHDAAHALARLPVAGGVGDGVPLYPGARIEDVGPVDLVALLAELTLIAAVCALLPDRVRARVITLMVVLAGLAFALRAAMVLA